MPCVATVAVMFRVLLVPLSNCPTIQIPEVLLYAAPWSLLTYVNPEGNRLLTCTLVVPAIPALWAVIVKITFAPTLGLVLFTDCDKYKSAEGAPASSSSMHEGAVPEQLAGRESGSTALVAETCAQFTADKTVVVVTVNVALAPSASVGSVQSPLALL